MMDLIVYHGTASCFATFRLEKREDHPSKIGIWFASSIDSAAIIAKSAKRMIDDVPRVVTAKIHIDSPCVFETYADYLATFRETGWSALKLRRRLTRSGFDAVVIKRSDTDLAGERVDYAIFSPAQIAIIDSKPWI